MMMLRKSQERGHANHGWLDSYHTFSFANYYDPRFMGFRDLRVINQDRIQGGKGFGTHSHRDMEIVTYMVEGALEHRDSLGNGAVIKPGEVQRMTAGTGVAHSEYNPSQTELSHLLQIWILPRENGLTPGYEQTFFPTEERQGRLRLIASPDGQEGSVLIHQDVSLYASLLNPGESVIHKLEPDRHAWVQVVRGQVTLNDQLLEAGDGAALSEIPALTLVGKAAAEILLFDLA